MAGLNYQDMIAALHAYWGEAGLRDHAAVPHGARRGNGEPRDVPPQPRPPPVEGGVRRAVHPPHRRPLRREPVSLPALLPVPGDPQAGTGERARPLLRLTRRDRHRPRPARHPPGRGRLGAALDRRLGPRLGGLVRRDGDHAVHVLPAGGRHRAGRDPGGDHDGSRAPGDVPPGQAERIRAGMGARAHMGRRLPRERAPVVAPTTSRRRRWTCSRGASPSTRTSART